MPGGAEADSRVVLRIELVEGRISVLCEVLDSDSPPRLIVKLFECA